MCVKFFFDIRSLCMWLCGYVCVCVHILEITPCARRFAHARWYSNIFCFHQSMQKVLFTIEGVLHSPRAYIKKSFKKVSITVEGVIHCRRGFSLTLCVHHSMKKVILTDEGVTHCRRWYSLTLSIHQSMKNVLFTVKGVISSPCACIKVWRR